MSRYFDALNRLRRVRDATSKATPRLTEQPDPVVDIAPVRGPGLPFPDLQLASRQASYAALLDLLRAKSKTASIPAVVIAGVAGGEPVRQVIAGIELQAQRQGVSLGCGHLELSTGARILHLSSRRPLREPVSPASRGGGESLRLSGSHGADALGKWLEKAASGSDLLLIEAPPLSSSVEGALLGGACQGLVLVAETLVTERSTLHEAIERARMAHTEILGLVLTGTRRWLPRWVERLIALMGRS